LICNENREDKTSNWWLLGGVIKTAATLFVDKDQYEDVMESAKSFIQLKYPEVKSADYCSINNDSTLVA